MAVKATSSVTLMMVSDGANGTDGKGISSIVHHYLVTNVTTGVTTSTSGWKTSPTSVTVTNKYLWYYQTINYTTGSPTNTTPAIIGVYGDTGGKGETGKGIKSVTPQYYLSTSNTTQTGGSWKTTQDAWSSGKYYWTRDSINWNDGTTTTTTPVLATGLNNANSTANNAQTIANQTASKFEWIVKSGTSSSNFTLTDRTAQLVAESINLKGLVKFTGLDASTQTKIDAPNNTIDNWAKDEIVDGETVINGGYIKTNSIKTNQLAVSDIFATGNAVMNIINSQEINANRITSGTIVANRLSLYGMEVLQKETNLTTLSIRDSGDITMRGSVESFNYASGKTGWSIRSNGDAEFNDVIVRGSLITDDGGVVSSAVISEDATKQVRFWAGTSYKERENAPWIVYNDGSMIAQKGSFSGVFTGDIKIGNISISDPSPTSGRDALLTIQNGQNGVKVVQLRDSDHSDFAQEIHITDNFYNEKISLQQDGVGLFTSGIAIGDNTTLNDSRLILNKNELASNEYGYIFKSPEVSVGSSIQDSLLNVYGDTILNGVLHIERTINFNDVVECTVSANGIDFNFKK